MERRYGIVVTDSGILGLRNSGILRFPNHQSPVTSLRSPVFGHQSPIPNLLTADYAEDADKDIKPMIEGDCGARCALLLRSVVCGCKPHATC
jgi:hypothetical protein